VVAVEPRTSSCPAGTRGGRGEIRWCCASPLGAPSVHC